MNSNNRNTKRRKDFPPYALFALLVLLVVDFLGDRLPVSAELLIGLIVVLSAIVIVSLVRSRNYLYVGLFFLVLLNLIADQFSFPSWTNIFLIAALIVVLPWVFWVAIKEYKDKNYS